MIKDKILSVAEFIKEFEETGAVFPTSKWAAEALTYPLRETAAAKRIIEIGAGSGAVTVPILEMMGPQDELTICEINPKLMEILKRRMERLEVFRKHKSRVTFFTGPIQEFPVPERKFDVIVCALPFLNFSRELTEQIFSRLKAFSAEKAVMTYYEYAGFKHLSKIVAAKERKDRVREVEAFFDASWRYRYDNRKLVLLNVPPVNIYTIHPHG